MYVSTVGLDEAVAIYVEPWLFFHQPHPYRYLEICITVYTRMESSLKRVILVLIAGWSPLSFHVHNCFLTNRVAWTPNTWPSKSYFSAESLLHYTVLSSSTENPAFKFRIIFKKNLID